MTDKIRTFTLGIEKSISSGEDDDAVNIIPRGGRITPISQCVEDLITKSYSIYADLKEYAITDGPISLICGGQSPAYLCLAMKQFSIYDPKIANVIVLPHSNSGLPIGYKDKFMKIIDLDDQDTQIVQDHFPVFAAFIKKYTTLLQSKNLPFNNNIVIIDYISSGSSAYALSLILSYLGLKKPIIINLKKPLSDITATDFASIIPVDKSYDILCQTDFGEYFPRIVQEFPKNINEVIDINFKTDFIDLLDNPIAQMIIEISSNYPQKNIKDNKWYQANSDPSKTKGPPQWGLDDFWIVNIPPKPIVTASKEVEEANGGSRLGDEYFMIVNPDTGNKVSIYGKIGRKIIKSYINQFKNLDLQE